MLLPAVYLHFFSVEQSRDNQNAADTIPHILPTLKPQPVRASMPHLMTDGA